MWELCTFSYRRTSFRPYSQKKTPFEPSYWLRRKNGGIVQNPAIVYKIYCYFLKIIRVM